MWSHEKSKDVMWIQNAINSTIRTVNHNERQGRTTWTATKTGSETRCSGINATCCEMLVSNGDYVCIVFNWLSSSWEYVIQMYIKERMQDYTKKGMSSHYICFDRQYKLLDHMWFTLLHTCICVTMSQSRTYVHTCTYNANKSNMLF